MCIKCDPLRETKVGYESRVKIEQYSNGEYTEMVLDRYKDHFDLFICSQDIYAFDIEYCPFCGEKIEPYEEVE